MLEAAARHEVEIGAIRDSLKSVADSVQSLAKTVDRLVDNQVFLQERIGDLAKNQDATQQSSRDLQQSLRDLERIVFRHVTDPGAHTSISR